ncbi:MULTISPECIES: LysR family transcriptional regulator [unclassified Pseudomonas]|uniref:LysR family transcriptional regulator n=1 Tax=unclassified Pseudomonas TaxID=196821 RepID=UPI000A0BD9EE|nr:MULTISPECIES: LysR family transcriptional regulator [unclassified Pseudomonas]SMF19236.1 DNA-binding transcriptional regulator, LysR family [Pseudomonas sp. LAIL14HWK12:I11]SMR77235.1 DNA-binding transcriptional regulator, LysR family [Pseudomonas sp. LAIL14HWK12:I10]SOD02990.1 DNA-binding transcriptional regulator, LysR family [Pseudomonas sp. LAIL14HWK12:I8]
MINFRLIRHLWLFLAVAEEKNFGRAAKRLGMTQPPLTEQIQILEQALKVKLFDRSRRGAALTPVGAAILPAVRKFADQLERLELAVEEAVAGHQGMVTIGAISSAMFDVLPEVIERFKQDHPQVTVSVREIDSVEAVPSLEAGDIDLAFARLDGDLGKGIEWRPLTEEQLMVALPVDHPLANHSEIALASLASEPLVMFARKVSPLYFDNLIATCRANGFSPRVLHEVRSVASQIAFVSCGQGIALVPAAMKKLAPANVVMRPLAQQVSVVTTTYAWNAERANPLVQALVNQLSKCIS